MKLKGNTPPATARSFRLIPGAAPSFLPAHTPGKPFSTVRVLGLELLDGVPMDAVRAVRRGGLLAAPSAPCMMLACRDAGFLRALRACDCLLPDSGFAVLVWRRLTGRKIRRISGLEFLRVFFAREDLRRPGALFMVNPSEEEDEINRRWLSRQGVAVPERFSYVAPFYSSALVEDRLLLVKLTKARPKYILINLGGGVQEKLGWFLKQNLPCRAGIICTGAAIAFLTGAQAGIPPWADRCRAGWLLRSLRHPRRFAARYLKCFGLAWLLARHKRENPLDKSRREEDKRCPSQ